MTILNYKLMVFLIILVLLTSLSVPITYAATTPNLGQATTFTILSSTYTNTVGGTTLNGNLGYSTGPATTPTVNGTTYSPPDTEYSTAGTDQGAALVALAAQPCTHIFPSGAVDLATDTSHGTIGVYEPGVYCTTTSSAASIGTGGITFSGSGTYIFRIDGALTTVANSVVSVASSASPCDVFWTPTEATTLGANSTFIGTTIDDAGITIGSTVTWTGRALSFGGTISTDADTISTPTCTIASPSPTATTSPSSQSSTATNTSTSNSCPALDSSVVTPIILESRRVNSNSIFISWGPYSGVDTFNVQYGFENGNWLFSTDVTGFSTTINDLPANRPIWVRVAARNSCLVGAYGSSVLVGGSTGGSSLANPLIPNLPNTGGANSLANPRLPNTGIAPRSQNNLWSIVITTGILSLVSILWVWYSKKRLRPL